ncbi:MAG TPA: AbrB/MazE/SpoVT family DNA-binding domain-containing protein [Candidatus Saccharimonadales bacterium]
MKDITLTISSKGQITVPKVARDKLGLKPGSKLHISKLTSDHVTLRREYAASDFYGKGQGLWDAKVDPVELVRRQRDADRA